jgi:AmmeMemoRadiSam system protein B
LEAAARGDAPRIVLPPGVEREEERELPEYPRMRPLMMVPITDGEREVLLVSDPLGVIQGQPVLSIAALGLLQLLDGTLSMQEITTLVARESKDIRLGGMIRDFIAQLDDLLMLESPKFERAYAELRGQYHALEIHQATCDGRSYPASPEELTPFLNAHVAAAEAMRVEAGEPVAADDALPRALLVPHLDPRRAGAVIARGWLELGPRAAEPLRVVVFGTGHQLIDDLYAFTRKHFETPLGRVRCDTAFVDAVAATLGDRAYHGELAHREEHSIEFAAVYLRHRLGDRPFTIVPVLCGGFHTLMEERKAPRDDAGFEAMLAAVRDVERRLGGPTLYVASVDLSHVGPRFGDPALDERVRGEIEQKDRAALEAAGRGDADAWFAAIAEHQDSTRICGFAPTYATLRCAEPGAGRLLRREASDEPDSTTVTVASMVWP